MYSADGCDPAFAERREDSCAMSFWTAIVTIVLIGTVGGLLRDVIKRKKDQPKRNGPPRR